MRSSLAVPAAALAAGLAFGSAVAQPPEQREKLEPRRNQKIERIKVEDASTRVDELRVGGETQSITVQPKKGDAPAYEIKPSSGERVWNVLKF